MNNPVVLHRVERSATPNVNADANGPLVQVGLAV